MACRWDEVLAGDEMWQSREQFTNCSRHVLKLAEDAAKELQHSHIGTEHLLIALMQEEDGVASHVLREIGLRVPRIQELAKQMTLASSLTSGRLPVLSPILKKTLEWTVDAARIMNNHFIGTEHLLLGMIRQDDPISRWIGRLLKRAPLDENIGLKILLFLNVEPEVIKSETHRLLRQWQLQADQQNGSDSTALSSKSTLSSEKETMVTDLDPQTLDNLYAAHIVNGHPPEQRMVSYHNVADVLESHATETPDAPYLIHYDQEGRREQFSYAEFNARVNQVANVLTSFGVGNGVRVATIAYNHMDTVIAYFACWKIGAAVAPQNVAEDDARIAFILRNSGATLALVMPDYLERAEKIIADAPNIRQIVQIGGMAQGNYPHLPTLAAEQSTTFTPANVPDLDTESLLVYTSGTTGAPKGVVLTQYNMLVDAHGIAEWQQITSEQRLMNVLPIHHVNGIVMTLITPLYVGGSVVLNRQYQSSTFWVRIAREHVQIVSVVPTLLQFSCEYADAQEAAGKSIWGEGVAHNDMAHFRHIVCGAGTLAIALVRRFEDRFGIPILHGYGLSETTCFDCFLPIDLDWTTHRGWLQDHGYPSIGCPIAPNEMAIFDASGSGLQLGPSERGEICARGHNVMKYYYQRPDANRETFKYGWFRSGDEGFFELDEQGRQFFFITGRIKELINRGGVKFSPFDIEEVLLEIPGVKVGLAIAFENDYYGEEVGAYVVLEDGAMLTEAQILMHCRARMTFEKSPKVVVFGTEIPVTTTGKYQRLKLRDRFADWKDVQFRKA